MRSFELLTLDFCLVGRDNTLTFLEDTTIEDVLKTVEKLYSENDYLGALRTLEENSSSISPGLWHYNMGTVKSALKDWPWARFHLLKAEKEGFFAKELTQNLEFVESNLNLNRLEKPSTVSDFLAHGAQVASGGILTSLSLLILVIGLVNLRKTKNLKSLDLLSLVVLSIMGINFWIQSWSEVIVLRPQVIYEGPSVILPGTEELPPGLRVLTRKEEGPWIEITHPERFRGWIKKDGVKEL